MLKQACRFAQIVLIILLLLAGKTGHSQDSCRIRISLLTCSPGSALYSLFGHTAIRVTDSTAGTDLVFNYGTFDDTDPYFYVKFTRGLMRYALSVYPFSDFEWEYQVQNRGVIEQTLLLNCAEKTELYEQLKMNAQEENRYYDYFFLGDNCTTRARDIIVKNADSTVVFRNILPPVVPSFRQMIHNYLDKGGQPWSKLGIDILLGSPLDKQVTLREATFLPDYLMAGFDSASLRSLPLVQGKQTVLTIPQVAANKPWFTPFLFFALLLVMTAAGTFIPSKRAKKRMLVFDRLFFFTLGFLGLLLVVLWIIRLDTVCRYNYNLLWAIPVHVFIAFALHKKTKWVRTYFRTTIIITALTLAGWLIIPQQLNPALIPVLLIILLRSWFRTSH